MLMLGKAHLWVIFFIVLEMFLKSQCINILLILKNLFYFCQITYSLYIVEDFYNFDNL